MIELRTFKDSDIGLFETWVNKPRILKWYKSSESWLNEIRQRNTKYNFIHHYIVICDGKDIGFCQYYDYSLGKETWHNNINIDNTYSIDYLIGEDDYIGKHIGTEMIKALNKIVFENTECKKIIVKPEIDNIISRKALLSAGYKYDDINDIFYIDNKLCK